jgi:hypothetical protein
MQGEIGSLSAPTENDFQLHQHRSVQLNSHVLNIPDTIALKITAWKLNNT